MMPTIRISDANWERMKKHARPLEDSADDVVGAALDALDQLKKPKPLFPQIKKMRRPQDISNNDKDGVLP